MACYKAWETGSRYADPLSLAENASSPIVVFPFSSGGAVESTRGAPGFRGRASLLRAAGVSVHALRARVHWQMFIAGRPVIFTAHFILRWSVLRRAARPSSLPRRPSVLGPIGRETPSTT